MKAAGIFLRILIGRDQAKDDICLVVPDHAMIRSFGATPEKLKECKTMVITPNEIERIRGCIFDQIHIFNLNPPAHDLDMLRSRLQNPNSSMSFHYIYEKRKEPLN